MSFTRTESKTELSSEQIEYVEFMQRFLRFLFVYNSVISYINNKLYKLNSS